VAFSSNRDDGVSQIWVIPTEGGTASRLTTQAPASGPRWSPDGRTLLFRSPAGVEALDQIWEVPAEGGAPEPLTEDGYHARMAYAPNGQSIAYQRHDGIGFDLYVMPASGGEGTQLTNGPGDESSPNWSPDGARVAFLADSALQVVSADGGDATRLTELTGDVIDFDWMPDGSALVYSFRVSSVNIWSAQVGARLD
jgi:TolB protein